MRLRTIAPAAAVLVLMAPFAMAQNHAPYYVLDAFGGVHAAGGAPVITPATPYFGFDVAADVTFIPVGTSTATGDGIIVLDKWGGVHYGGALATHPPSGGTPYFGFDAARAIEYRDVSPRVAGASVLSAQLVTSSTFVVLQTVDIHAPDDGFLLVSGSTNMYCLGAGTVRAEAGINVDGSGQLEDYLFDAPDCTAGLFDMTANAGMTKLFPVSAGNHTVNLVGRRASGTQTVGFAARSITALFVDHDGVGVSGPVSTGVRGPAGAEGPDGRSR